MVAFRNRVAEMCKAAVTTENAVKGDKESNGLIENTAMLTCGVIRLKAAHKKNSETTRQLCGVWWNMQDASYPGVNKVATGERHSKDCMARNRHAQVSHLVRKCWQSKSPQIP